MDWVSVQCSCQSFTFGVPFVGLGKFYTVDSPKEIGPFLAKEKKMFFSLPRKKNIFFPWQGKKKPHPWYLQMLCLTQVFVEPRLQKMASILKFVMACNNVDWHPKNTIFHVWAKTGFCRSDLCKNIDMGKTGTARQSKQYMNCLE